jgi:23S rRNA (pseudouridine1915-N3)-methyltransferase
LRITLLCAGALAGTPEAKLAQDYVDRASATGRGLALAPVEIVEVAPRKRGKMGEGEAMRDVAGSDRLIACDRRGSPITSRQLADLLARVRDDGTRRLVFAVGGADGLDEGVLGAAFQRLSFGSQTWPHALARVMLAEQVYRAATILAGAPYHRE